MNNGVKYLIFVVLILLIQMLTAEFVNIHPLIYISILPLIILLLPYNMSVSAGMLTACGLGAFADFSYDGIVGLNIAALTAVAYLRRPLLHLVVSKSARETLLYVSTKSIGVRNFIFYTILIYLIFIAIYVALDNVLFFSPWVTLLRISVSVCVNTIIAILLERTLVKQIF